MDRNQGDKIARKIRKALEPIPDGYKVVFDEKTSNILITGPTLGFCRAGKH